MTDNREGLERSSSFARSFFQAGQGTENYEDAEGIPGLSGPAAMKRQRSRRRMSSRGSSDRQLIRAAAAAAAAAQQVQYDEGEPTQNLPHMGNAPASEEQPPLPANVDRQTSWYTDALLQGGGAEDLSAILGQDGFAAASAAAGPAEIGADTDEVLEQYRIMAHVEANYRVKDNTGFDMADYEKRRKLQPEPTKGDYYSGPQKPKPILPEARLVGAHGALVQKPEEPSMPPPRGNRRFLQQRAPKVAELSPGIVVRGQGNIPPGEHVVRCLGCKSQLRVNMLASLVNCPECSTVSPASSTRH